MSVFVERQIARILIPDVEVIADKKAFDQLFEIHYLKKQLFAELVKGQADFEEIFEALETFIGTANMDAYLLETSIKLEGLNKFYELRDRD